MMIVAIVLYLIGAVGLLITLHVSRDPGLPAWLDIVAAAFWPILVLQFIIEFALGLEGKK